MCVEDNNIWTSGEFIMQRFEDAQDTDMYMASDKINHMIVDRIVPESDDIVTVLGCHDQFVRIVKGSDVLHETAVDGSVSALMRYDTQEQPENSFMDDSTATQLIYGTEDGLIGQLLVGRNSVQRGYAVQDPSRRGAITSMCSSDLTHDGIADLLVGRDDGSFEIYGFDMSPIPQVQYEKDFGESVTSVTTGHILSMKNEDVLLATYSGKIMCVTDDEETTIVRVDDNESEKESKKAEASLQARVAEHKEQQQRRIQTLREEIADVEAQVARAQERYQRLSTANIAVKSQFTIKSRLKLLPDEACYVLSVEVQSPIDTIMLQSDVSVILMDNESSSAIVSQTTSSSNSGNGNGGDDDVKQPHGGGAGGAFGNSIGPNGVAGEEDNNELLATFRCQQQTNRVEIKLRTMEGKFGVLNVYVIPQITPKSCQKVSFQIKPLSLHEKVHKDAIQEELQTRALNTMKLTGSFSISQIHSFVDVCLPDVPPRVTSESVSMWFRSTFLGTILACEYKQGSATFVSDSFSALSIIKEIITKEMTKRKLHVSYQLDLKDRSVFDFLALLKPKLEYHVDLNRKHELITPLREIQQHEDDVSFLSDELRGILANAASIQEQVKQAPLHVQFLQSVLSDLFLDVDKLKGGRAAADRMGSLLAALSEYDMDAIHTIFQEVLN
eukprot:TRINITY_DN62654_c0_g1_i1.p1 TRINITY_DN62654_c0_g1~~TRINITY_DN62654_c0_g1_i1.p1  ORF type:complete len:784 (+),score=456.15 TRINITY_DN62654_c0_g1_i1:348-2354(+)